MRSRSFVKSRCVLFLSLLTSDLVLVAQHARGTDVDDDVSVGGRSYGVVVPGEGPLLPKDAFADGRPLRVFFPQPSFAMQESLISCPLASFTMAMPGSEDVSFLPTRSARESPGRLILS